MNDEDRKAAKKIIFRRLKGMDVPSANSSSATPQLITSVVPSNPLQKLASICGQTVALSASAVSTRSMTLDEELCAYVEAAKSATDFQSFWKQHSQLLPRLSHLVRRVSFIPATSVASESLFSIASFLNRKQRSSLSSRSLRYLLVWKDRHLLDRFE
jgi:hAT family C-terminal dimerisation region